MSHSQKSPEDRKAVLVPNPAIPLGLAMAAAVLAGIAGLAGVLNLAPYRAFTPPHLIPGTVSQDIGAVLVSVGLLVLSVRLWQGDERWWFVWQGGLGYLFYGYAIYLFEGVLTPFFPAYIAIVSLSLWGMIAFYARLRFDHLQVNDPPRKLTATLFIVLTGLFAFLWSGILLTAILAQERPDGLTILMLDLVFVLPLMLLAAILLFKERLFGDLLAIPILIKAGSIGLSVFVGTLLSPLFGLPARPEEIATYALLGFGPLLLIVPWMRRIKVGSQGSTGMR